MQRVAEDKSDDTHDDTGLDHVLHCSAGKGEDRSSYE